MIACAALSKRSRGSQGLVLRTSAKVNLALEVLGKRGDGYHEIATVLQAVDLFDRLTMETADILSLHADDPELPTDDGNLVMRAARLLQKTAGIEKGARLRLQKRIPVAAGLGGGSSDAAATLLGLNRLWGLRWPRARLQELAVELGMDVPFFLGTGRAVARGRGERLQALPGGGGYALVLVNPRTPLSTREVYGRVPAGWHAEPTGTERVIEALRRRNVAALAAALTNNLERVVEPVLPVIGRMKAALLAAGALGAIMSGSGPTVFGLARSLDHARQVRSRVSRAGWACWAVRTNSGPAIRASR
ncbi:MAG TPA: 4-(cytidine 5'-diphospho)-2-C-methyl-D-erythritol kinase [Methylomirabilota bacterium]|nr:4-(cytidine 5'-diphospho)-2-C-methyl-D-erythritol kinase [Methylomirabilota bacterium]